MKDQKPPEKFLAAVFVLIIVVFVVLWRILSQDSIPDNASRDGSSAGQSVVTRVIHPDLPLWS